MQSVILFDGVCNLCNGFVQFVVRNDRKGKFKFASLQSEFSQRELSTWNIDHQQISTVILLDGGRIYSKSTAALKILRKLDGFWPLLFVFIVVPKFLRDAVYNTVAKNRYKWFGKKESCMLPTPELKDRFLF